MSSRTFTFALLILTLLVIFSGIASSSCSSRRLTADLVIRADVIYTAYPARPKAEAVAVRAGRIIDVGRRSKINRLIGKRTRVLDYDGAVLPGLIDAHGHLASLGRALSRIDLVGTRDKDEILAKVKEAIPGSAVEDWITGRGWDQNDWPDQQFPTWKDLRETESRAVALWRVDGHAVWVNRTALRLAGITSATPNPAGGRILHDDSGEPTGVLIDKAMDLVSQQMPKEDVALRRKYVIAGMKECNRFGLVGVGDAAVDSLGLAVYRGLAEKGELTLRVYAMLDGSDQVFAEQEMLHGPQGSSSDMLRVRSLKMFADGALGSRGAALLEPYSDDPGNYGLITTSRAKLARMTSIAMDRGFQVCVHAIGDSANRMVLDVFSAALLGRNPEDFRLRVEHAQILDSLDIPRFGEQGVIASMQPTHATSDMPWVEERLGPERTRVGAYVWRSLLDSGARLCFGSDFPVESPNPMLGLYAAVTRQDTSGNPPGGWMPEQRLSMEEALDGFTIDAAYAEFAERVIGSIEKGKLADFTVIDTDIFQADPKALIDAKVLATIVDGVVVYDSKTAGGGE